MTELLEKARLAALEKRFDKASQLCAQALEAQPEHPPALALFAMIQVHRGHLHAGIELLERAIALGGRHPAWLSDLGAMYRQDCRIEEALALGNEAMVREPDNPNTLLNLSLTLTDLGRTDSAKALLLRAIGLKHDHADVHLAMAQNLLMDGDYRAGLREYEWRNLSQQGLLAPLPGLTSAPWNGMHLPGGKLLVIADQGFGDCIQYARFLPTLAALCEEVLLGCSPEMLPLLAEAPGVGRAYTNWPDIPGHCAHCRLSSAPYLLGITELTVPRQAPYLFADPDRVAFWGKRLDTLIPGYLSRVGLVWAGRPTHGNDRRRSLPLEALAPLGRAVDVCFVPLHPTMTETDRTAFKALFRPSLLLSDDQLHDFGETAALIAKLDLVITVDTAAAHLAGALGKPVWVMLPQAADFRWLRAMASSIWYPTARLFRQPATGVWAPVIEEVAEALRNFR